MQLYLTWFENKIMLPFPVKINTIWLRLIQGLKQTMIVFKLYYYNDFNTKLIKVTGKGIHPLTVERLTRMGSLGLNG